MGNLISIIIGILLILGLLAVVVLTGGKSKLPGNCGSACTCGQNPENCQKAKQQG